jgi:phosphatidylserine/phosphatidylglycerophosphate/cardiolipin synthase-like enzyme
MNYTISEAYRNNNNLVRIRSAELAEDYTAEFTEMFEADQFGPGSPANTPYPALTIQGIPLEIYFSPDDSVEGQLERLLRSAQEDIFFLAFSFTSDELAQAILDRAAAGVTVAGVMDNSQYKSNLGSEYDAFRSAGLDVRLDGNPRNMHHKVIILDQSTVITGSYNYTFSAATRNDENLLVIHSPEIAALFLEEFQKVFLQAR